MGDLLVTVGLTIRDGTNTPRVISKLIIRDGTNTPREISALYVRDTNNVSRLVYNPSGSLTLSISINQMTVSGLSAGTGTATTDAATSVTTGGASPFTYAWTVESYTAGVAPTANSPTSSSSTFTQTSMDPGAIYNSIWRLTVTDDNGATASDTVGANFADTT